MKFFEHISVGERTEIGRYTFTADAIKAFAARFDPQPFHLDEAAAERSHFGRLCASGWHTACVWMRLVIEHRKREDDERRARGEAVAALGVSPGFRDLKWLKPLCRRYDYLRHRGDRQTVIVEPLAMGYHDCAQFRRQSARRAGSLFRQYGLRRAQAGAAASPMTLARGETTDHAGSAAKRDERRAAAVAFGAHALHDGYTDLIYVLLPVWQREFGLGYAELGLLRGVFAGTMASFQIPSGLLSERLGTAAVLALGTALAGVGYCLAGASAGFGLLVVALLVGGLGASTQHPLASALVARAFAGPRSLKALGTYNFSGDIGKMTVPAAAALLLTVMPWRPALALLGALGLVAAVAIYLLTPRYEAEAAAATAAGDAGESAPAARRRFAFPVLLSIGMLDSATRMAFLTFLPFVLTAKGASLPTIGLALTLVFAGGAAGKLVCAFIGARIGTIATVWLTEGLTAVLIVALLPLPVEAALVLLPLIGVALNGTSSVLYGSVPVLVTPERRARAFSVFYTGTIGSGAIAPAIYGVVGDQLGVPAALIVIAAVVLLTLPLSLALKPALPA
jgi:MFS family permease